MISFWCRLKCGRQLTHIGVALIVWTLVLSNQLVKATAQDMQLPAEVAGSDMSLRNAEAAVERAKEALRLAEAQRKASQEKLGESQMAVGKAELREARAELVEDKTAVEVHDAAHIPAPAASHGIWPFAKRGMNPLQKKSFTHEFDLMRGEMDVAMAEAGVTSNSVSDHAEPQLNSRASGHLTFLLGAMLCLTPVGCIASFLKYREYRRRELMGAPFLAGYSDGQDNGYRGYALA